MAGGIVRGQDSAGNEVRNDSFITGRVSLFVGIQKTKGDIFEIVDVPESVVVNELNGVGNSGDAKCLSSQSRFLRQNFKGGEFASGNPASEGQPESGIAGARSDLDAVAGRSRRGENGQEPSDLGRDLFEAFGQRRAISAIASVRLFQKFHSAQDRFGNVMKHGVSRIKCVEEVPRFFYCGRKQEICSINNWIWFSSEIQQDDVVTTESENNLLTRVGPGMPMGNLLRQYWIPVLQSDDLPENDGAPVRVRLLCENLIAFRNTEGKVGLLDHACPHRCASLSFGRNEENGIRCLYHGWKFDIEGRCVDVPNEPAGSKFNEQIRATAYPCIERNGLIWTYMGPNRDNPPPLPQLGWAMVEPKRRGALRYQRECNWLQAMEGDFDSSHLSFLHLTFDPKNQGATNEKSRALNITGTLRAWINNRCWTCGRRRPA